MKKFRKLASLLMLTAAVVFAAGCTKPDEPNNEGNEGGDEPTPSVLAEEGMYLGILGFNEVLTEKQIGLLNTSTKSSYISFINSLNMADGTALYYADYTALHELQSFPEPSALKKVALVTFTDGLDNLSTSSSMMNPENYGSLSDYRTALHKQILNEKVHGNPITAYTIGLRGNDVQNNLTEFRANLNMLASDANNVFEVTDMTEALDRFRTIAENLYYAVTSINLKLKLPGGFDEGSVLRFTFDDVNDADSSQEYIECIYKRTSNNGRRLESVSYHGFVQGASALDAVSQTETGTFHWFEFEGLTHLNGDVVSQYDINHIQLWKKQGTVWQRDSEFTPGSSTEVTETKSSALIMLVLDCTSSLGSDFSMMKTGAIRFVESLCSGGGEHGFTISVSANPTDGGTVTGGGIFQHGQSCTVSAVANPGYTFDNWAANGNVVSSNADYNFTVTGNRVLTAQFQIQSYSITATASPTEGGTVSGGGSYDYGETCTLTATPNSGYSFVNWTENGSEVSNNANYSFTVTGNRNMVANFTVIPQYTVSVSANPAQGGMVTGSGSYQQGQSCTVVATAALGFVFYKWTENGTMVSKNPSFTFSVNSNRNLIANFIEAPEGSIKGLFTINRNGDKVFFSQGNLQYIGSAGNGDENNTGAYWKFAENQWEYLGDNGQGSDSQTVDRDLFGWGTSGYHNVDDDFNVNYQPWSIISENNLWEYNHWGYGPSTNMLDPNLTGTSAEYDWGVHNAILNGGNQAGLWRTLTRDEWLYVFKTRSTSTVGGTADARYVFAKVNEIAGVILFPDVYDHPSNLPNLTGINEEEWPSFNSNHLSSSEWNTMEDLGCVFLPAAGIRYKTSVNNVVSGFYWSVSYYDNHYAKCLHLTSSLSPSVGNEARSRGCSVRLVRLAQ